MIYIYGLIDPLTHKIAYVGKTNDLYVRWEAHVKTDAKHKAGEWLKRLRASGIEPTLVVLEEVDDDENWAVAERWWITHGLRTGWPINNTAHTISEKIGLTWIGQAEYQQHEPMDGDDLWLYIVRTWRSFRWYISMWRRPSAKHIDWSLAQLPTNSEGWAVIE